MLRERLDAGEALTLLDVREPRERAFCAIAVPPTAGDLHIPMRQIPAHLDELQAAARPRSARDLLSSRRPLDGRRGMAGRRGLAGILNLHGGIDAWSTEVDPTVPQVLTAEWTNPRLRSHREQPSRSSCPLRLTRGSGTNQC